MRNDRSLSFLKGSLGGLLAGLALSQGGFILMPIATAFLWGVSSNIWASSLWGVIAVLISHRWLLSLHPLNWIGIPGPLSLLMTFGVWIFCGALGGALVGCWSWVANCSIFLGKRGLGLGEKALCVIVLVTLWGLGEIALAQTPLFWIGIGSSVLPGDRFLAGLARWIGAGGLSAVLLVIGYWLWQVWAAFSGRKKWIKSFLIGLCGLFFAHLIGFNLLLEDSVSSESIPVAIWQSDIPTRTKFSPEQQERIPKALLKALQFSKGISASWLIAPEGTLSARQDLVIPSPLPLLSGGFRWVRGEQRSSLLVFETGNDSFSNAIDKHRLVPLGEWFPSLPQVSFEGLSAIGGLQPGKASRLLSWSGPPAAVAICYELTDGHSIAKAVGEGAEWIVAIANLDPYPISLQKQFLSLAQLRSIETARDLISSANTGPSALILASGKVQTVLPAFSERVGLVNLNIHKGFTGYTSWGEAPLILFFLVGFLGIAVFRLRD